MENNACNGTKFNDTHPVDSIWLHHPVLVNAKLTTVNRSKMGLTLA